MENNELMHWGVRGMKWGVRRYQNKDGTLTNAGKKRYAKELAKVKEQEQILKNKQKTQAKIDNLNERRKKIEDAKNGNVKPKLKHPVKKAIKDVSDEELRAKVARLELEKRYADLMKTTKPKEHKKGEFFVNEMLAPAAKDIGKQTTAFILGTAANAALANIFNDPKAIDPKNIQKKK